MLEVADAFHEAGPAYRERFAARILPSRLKAMRDIERCRTPALGGHLHQCNHCAHLQYSYHSCRNRHCPKCEGDHTQRWLDQQQARLLPCPYYLVTAGGLTEDRQAWRRPARRDFLIPCRALSVIFRAKIRDALERAKLLEQVPRKAWKKKWVTHCRHAGDGQKALLYVARYIHRVAITNSRLESFEQQQVTFRYRDSRSRQLQRCTLSADQFISRFLQYVLPSRFTKVRYCGLFSPACRDALEQACSLLRQTQQPPEEIRQVQDAPGDTEFAGSNRVCQVCHIGRMMVVADLAPQRQPQARLRAPPEAAA